ncbi:hypothetical protein D9619_006949 [Psilocybe cf. subviscida]|uniref:Protein kinase domain-containing protein n=1 Tax=Psilocybe cf. subviscida TaxID=2480587 RepID=A0A8H5EWT1_9AGAR|nr:hypothetical protein D9619_006949 [Psilocybe cf. subviscida]
MTIGSSILLAGRVPLAVDAPHDLWMYASDQIAHGDFHESFTGIDDTAPATVLQLLTTFATHLVLKRASVLDDPKGAELLLVVLFTALSGAPRSRGSFCVLLYFYVTKSKPTLLGFVHFGTLKKPLITHKASDSKGHVFSLNLPTPPRLRHDFYTVLSWVLGLGYTARLYCYFEGAPRRSSPHILFNNYSYNPNTTHRSIFSFLRYTGPRRLRRARKVLLDDQGYHITHIGQGAFASISRVLYKPTGEVRVMKRITFDETGLAKYLAKNEIYGLKTMKGSIWFPALLNDFAENGEYVVTMPYYHRGDLAAFIEQKRLLGRDVAQFYCAQLLLAIQSLHKYGIVHRDIKTDNIFLDEAGHLVLADLGLAENIAAVEGGEDTIKGRYTTWMEARSVGGDKFPFLWADESNPLSIRGVAGTFWYTAPEVFRKELYSFGVDYWSLGVIYHELITGHIPFGFGISYPEDKQPILDFGRKPGQLKGIERWEEDELSQLLSVCPTGRPNSVHDIKNLRLFSAVNWSGMSKKQIPPPRLPLALKEDSPYTRSFRLREHNT